MKDSVARLISAWPLVLVTVMMIAMLAWFITVHGRLPLGSGEVLNWLLGLESR